MGDDENYGNGDEGGGNSGEPVGALFEFTVGGIGVMQDPADNPDGHVVPHHEAGTRISFEVINVGDAGAVARVGVEVDDVFVEERETQQIEPGMAGFDYVSLGRLSEGEHTVLVYVNPGSGNPAADHAENTFGVE
jgi:hypothetical protein